MGITELVEDIEKEYSKSDRVSCPAPRALADKYLQDVHPMRTLQWYRGEWWTYADVTGWQVVDSKVLHAVVSDAMTRWWYVVGAKKNGKEEIRSVYSLLRNSLLRDIEGQLRQPNWSIVSELEDMPIWLNGDADAKDYLPVANGLLHLPTRQLHSHTPTLFSPYRLDFEYRADAPKPERWLSFLDQLWPDDAESRELLQLWFGYTLTADTHFDKMLLLVGPKRSGKSTIAAVNQAMIGTSNCCAPTLGGLSQNFGLANIVNKRLAVIGDARLSGRADSAIVVERLLSLTGRDLQAIPRKFRDEWEGRPDCRFMLLSNELPRLPDSSGALASRMILLQTSQSFYGQEDHGLRDALLAELPGILKWSLDGLDRLTEHGRFPEVATAADAVQALHDLGSPVSAFVRDCCELSPGIATRTASLYQAWRDWCESEGIEHISTQAVFGRDLMAAFPEIKKRTFRVGAKREKNYQGISLVTSSH